MHGKGPHAEHESVPRWESALSLLWALKTVEAKRNQIRFREGGVGSTVNSTHRGWDGWSCLLDSRFYAIKSIFLSRLLPAEFSPFLSRHLTIFSWTGVWSWKPGLWLSTFIFCVSNTVISWGEPHLFQEGFCDCSTLSSQLPQLPLLHLSVKMFIWVVWVGILSWFVVFKRGDNFSSYWWSMYIFDFPQILSQLLWHHPERY